MKLRLRGYLHHEVEWVLARIPSVTEMFYYRGQWYRIVNVAWAVASDDSGADVALVLAKANPPPVLEPKDLPDEQRTE